MNKVLRQQAVMTAGLANAISQVNSQSVLDDGNVTALINFIIRAIQNSNSIWLSSVSGTNAITAAVAPLAIAPPSYVAGARWLLLAGTTNSGAVTLNITGNVAGVATPLGARSIFKRSSSGPVALVANDLVAGNVYQLVDDGTRFIIVGARPYAQFTSIPSAATLNLDAVSGDYGHVTGSITITAITLAAGEKRTVVFDAAPIVTNNANIIVPGSVNYQAAAGDAMTFRGEGSGVVRVTQIQKGGGSTVTTSVFTSSGTWNRPAGVQSVIVEVLGAGGGGGGSNSGVSSFFAASGGGAGGFARKRISVVSISSSTITVGTGGAGGSAGSNNGSDGTASSWADGTNTVTGNGGSKGLSSSVDFQPGGSGGTASGGDISVTGNGGGWSWVNTSVFTVSGAGGGSVFGGGAPSTVLNGVGTNSVPGVAGSLGAGGSGATTTRSSTSQAGGTGGGGVVIVTEFRN